MNPEKLTFHEEPKKIEQAMEYPPEWPRFTIGQEVTVNGVLFKIHRTHKDLILRPVKR